MGVSYEWGSLVRCEGLLHARPHLTKRLNRLVSESQLPRKIVNILFIFTDENNKLTILRGSWLSNTIWFLPCVDESGSSWLTRQTLYWEGKWSMQGWYLKTEQLVNRYVLNFRNVGNRCVHWCCRALLLPALLSFSKRWLCSWNLRYCIVRLIRPPNRI